MPTLIKWSSNWADEMEVRGFVIVNDKEELNLFKSNLQKDQPITIWVGTNEEIDYDTMKDLSKEIEMIELSFEQEKVIKETLGDYWGLTSFYWVVLDLD